MSFTNYKKSCKLYQRVMNCPYTLARKQNRITQDYEKRKIRSDMIWLRMRQNMIADYRYNYQLIKPMWSKTTTLQPTDIRSNCVCTCVTDSRYYGLNWSQEKEERRWKEKRKNRNDFYFLICVERQTANTQIIFTDFF